MPDPAPTTGTTRPSPSSPLPHGWTAAELANPHGNADKAEKVRGMFGAIARSYDLNNRVHSMGRDQAWRRYAVKRSGVGAGGVRGVVYDVACGTGDLSEAFAKAGASKVVGIDFTQGMLDIAEARRRKLRASGVAGKIEYRLGDAQELPMPDASAVVVSIAFGIRNVADPARAVREFRRVLKPGGRLVVLEFGTPRLGVMRWLNDVYCKRVMPVTATLISGDRTGAYKYLPASVETFMTTGAFCELMRESGFADVTATPLTGGICVCYRGVAAK